MGISSERQLHNSYTQQRGGLFVFSCVRGCVYIYVYIICVYIYNMYHLFTHGISNSFELNSRRQAPAPGGNDQPQKTTLERGRRGTGATNKSRNNVRIIV